MPTAVKEKTSFEDRLLSAFEGLSEEARNGTHEAVTGRRRHAIERFEALGFPSKDLETYKYTNLARALRRRDDFRLPSPEAPRFDLSRADLDPLLLPDLDAHLVVTVGGRFSEQLSDVGALPGGAFAGSFAEGGKSHPAIFEQHYGQYAEVEEHAMAALNTAFARDGLFVYVPEGVRLERPVFALHLPGEEESLFTQPRHLFVVEDDAYGCVVEMHRALDSDGSGSGFTNAVREAFVGAHGHFDHYLIQDDGTSQHATFAAHQETESVFDTLTATLSGDLVRNDLTITPAAEHCETHLFGLYLGEGAMHVDNHTIVEHAAPDCLSNELYKGILTDEATGVFNGRVHVHRGAQRINAYQSNKSIVLTDTAHIYSKPELEIYADDVQCSHGSTTGQLDEEALFYLRSRGIPTDRARAMLLGAFARDVVENVRLDALRTWLDDEVARRFGRSNG